MSQQLINRFLSDLDTLRKMSGSLNEQVIRNAFMDLLKAWARQNDLFFVPEHEFRTSLKTIVYPDGTILHALRVPLGYWEAKDTKDDLDSEIAKKFAKGYPQDNIIFENSHTAVLIQNRQEVIRCEMTDTAALQRLLTLFFSYERAEISDFRKAVAQFKTDIPAVLDALREKIDAAYDGNKDFKKAAAKFLKHAKDTINPAVTEADVREMLIQHILTEEIFAHVFDQGDFHRENNIAKELYALEAKFFTGAIKRETLKSLEAYYATIRSNAALITKHSEKQTFLKVIYENFYKVYNPKAADRLGVVYTPNEIVKFMIEGADWLCEKHFGKNLIDRDVEILDPATGTGTFICELLESFRGQPQKLAHKYKEELHANEVAILPYYVANLNIEATYAVISGQFAEFPNLCFVDTLDNVAGLGIKLGQHVGDLFGGLSEENVARVKRQNKRKISVILGNPPYNANQANENDNNKNREYAHVDKLIKESYIKHSTAQKTKVYDMYARFFRWASDRMHDDGILAYITNRSFIESRTFDGFRKTVADEFSEIYVMDLGGDVRANPKLSGTKHNVFGIQTGVAISFFVKRDKQKGCKIFYARRPEMETAEDKLAFLGSNKASLIQFEQVKPDKTHNWVNLGDSEWESFLPLADKKTKAAKKKGHEQAICRLFSLGVSTNRDEWIFDISAENLDAKMRFFIQRYDESALNGCALPASIKASRNLKRRLQTGRKEVYSFSRIATAVYRPFVSKSFYRSNLFIDETGSLDEVVPFGLNVGQESKALMICGHPQLPFTVHTIRGVPDAGYASRATQMFPRFTYATDDDRIDNITDWGLRQFQSHYEKGTRPKRRIGKDDIFDYVYGVLHDPVYRETYAINLKREFPRIPFYPDFWKWAAWGKRLMELHIGYETVEPWPLTRHDVPPASGDPKPMLKADKAEGTITLDSATSLFGIPPHAFNYRLGNRSALEWVLDQHKEKKPKDPTIAAKFNTYRFKDYKEKVVDLLARVTRVSVETMEIVEAMREAERGE